MPEHVAVSYVLCQIMTAGKLIVFAQSRCFSNFIYTLQLVAQVIN